MKSILNFILKPFSIINKNEINENKNLRHVNSLWAAYPNRYTSVFIVMILLAQLSCISIFSTANMLSFPIALGIQVYITVFILHIYNLLKRASNEYSLPLNLTLKKNSFTGVKFNVLAVNYSLVESTKSTFNKSRVIAITLGNLTPRLLPKPLLPLVNLVELLGHFIRPVALGLRIGVNILVGHGILSALSIVSSYTISFPPMGLTILYTLITIIELIIPFIQAYIYTSLIAMFFLENGHHH